MSNGLTGVAIGISSQLQPFVVGVYNASETGAQPGFYVLLQWTLTKTWETEEVNSAKLTAILDLSPSGLTLCFGQLQHYYWHWWKYLWIMSRSPWFWYQEQYLSPNCVRSRRLRITNSWNQRQEQHYWIWYSKFLLYKPKYLTLTNFYGQSIYVGIYWTSSLNKKKLHDKWK